MDKVIKISILAEINVDKLTENYHDRGRLYLQNLEITKDTFIEEVTNDIREAVYE